MPAAANVIVIGSGISGAFVAHGLLERGLSVLLLDVGNDDREARESIPDLPFSEIVKDLDLAKKIFISNISRADSHGRQARVGSQLTPPRQFITRATSELLPFTEPNPFQAMQSLALGGLGAGWGAGCFTFTPDELRRCGIWEEDFSELYTRASEIAGISGGADDDVADMCQVTRFPPLEIDSNHEAILQRYQKRARRGGFKLGHVSLAMLSQDKDELRRANPYFDMDFYSDARRSIFRPRYLIEAMCKLPKFTYVAKQLALGVMDQGTSVEVRTRDVESDAENRFVAAKVVVCAGALNSARLLLHSLQSYDSVPVLANPYHYLACINLQTFGRAARDRRHSMAQLLGVYCPPDNPADVCVFPFFSYRSLLMFKLVKEFPLPPRLGMLVARSLLSSFTIVGLWHSCTTGKRRFAKIEPGAFMPKLSFTFEMEDEWQQRIHQRDTQIKAFLRSLGVIPLKAVDTGPAGGIHYAGTLPSKSTDFREFTRPSGQLRDMPNVYCGDSAPWNFLPAKGLSFTLMANGLRVARHVAGTLK